MPAPEPLVVALTKRLSAARPSALTLARSVESLNTRLVSPDEVTEVAEVVAVPVGVSESVGESGVAPVVVVAEETELSRLCLPLPPPLRGGLVAPEVVLANSGGTTEPVSTTTSDPSVGNRFIDPSEPSLRRIHGRARATAAADAGTGARSLGT